MSDEVIKQIAEEATPLACDEDAQYLRGIRQFAVEGKTEAIRLYHERHVAPIEQENEALKKLLGAFEWIGTEHSKTIEELHSNVAPLLEALRNARGCIECMEPYFPDGSMAATDAASAIQQIDTALAPFEEKK